MKLIAHVGSADHSRGPATAAGTLVEYAAYACPHAKRARGIVDSLARAFGSQLRIVFRNFTLVEIHPDALNAALVAESAGPAHFWRLHDLIFAGQPRLDVDSLIGYAEQAGIADNVARAALDGATLARVRADVASGNESGVNSTPTFFINGVQHAGDWSLEALADAIRRAAAKKTVAP